MVSDDSLSPDVPAAFRSAYRGFVSLRLADATPWRPEQLDVAAWPFPAPPDPTPVAWPAGWPTLKSPGVETRKDKIVGEIWAIHLPYAYRDQLEAKRYACPDCVRLLDVEIKLKSDPPLFDMVLQN